MGSDDTSTPATSGTPAGPAGPTDTSVDAADAVGAASAVAAAVAAAGDAATRAGSGPTSEGLRVALADAARRFARIRLDAPDSDEMLTAIVAGARDAIPAVAAASISLIERDGAVTTRAPSDELVAEIDGIQVELGEGPCIDALRGTGEGVTDVPDLADAVNLPWPRFASRARDAGFACVLSYQLVADRSAGALNLWGRVPKCFSDRDRLVGALFADQAAVALAGARRAGQLHRALAHRDVIGRAKGVLMERFRIPDDAAFTMLIESSQTTNMKLVDVATWLVADAEAGYARGSR